MVNHITKEIKISSDKKIVPEGYENYLSTFKTCLFDGNCGEPVAWGFEIIHHMSGDKFNILRQFGTLECSYPKWFLITKYLTQAEAIEKYGKITKIKKGPRGGFHSITFGETNFSYKKLKENTLE